MKRARPRSPSPLRDAAMRLHRAGDLAGAERLYDLLLPRAEADAELHYLVGVLRHQQGRPEDALARLRRALEIRPDDPAAWALAGVAAAALDRPAEALAAYDRSLALRPDHWEVLNNRALALADLGRAADSLADADAAIALRPGLGPAHNNRGHVLLALGRPAESLAAHARALALDPGHGAARAAAAAVLARLDDPVAAAAALPGLSAPDAAALLAAGAAELARRGAGDAALAGYDRALALMPDDAALLNLKAVALAEWGRLDAATDTLARAIAAAPGEPVLYYNHGLFGRFTPDHPYRAALKDLLRDADGLSEDGKIYLRFALAKAADDVGDPDGAMTHLLVGNALHRARIAYDPAATEALLDRIRAVFTAERLAGAARGAASARPIFVVGMPRSGSTLVERVLASHPKVAALGETDAFRRVLDRIGASHPVHDPSLVADLSGADLRRLGEAYLAEVPAPGAERIVDKTLVNAWSVGPIHLALPGARFVHTVRDPVDTCLSCFGQLFNTSQPFAYDLGDLGRYHRAVAAVMAHWRGLLPPDVILEVRYEALVADPEGQARRMVAHAGLAWDAACLAPHLQGGPVRTASVAQVRRPIHGASVGRWRPPPAVLRPLLDALGDDAPPSEPSPG